MTIDNKGPATTAVRYSRSNDPTRQIEAPKWGFDPHVPCRHHAHVHARSALAELHPQPLKATSMARTEIPITTTNSFEGRRIVEYRGLVSGDAILGANMFRDMFAGLRDMIGGRSGAYEKVLRSAKTEAIEDMLEAARERGGNAVVGVDLDYETIQIQDGGSMLMVSATGTAVVLE